MKKKIALLVCCMALAMTACGKEKVGDAAQDGANAQTEDAQAEDAQAEEAQTDDAQTETAQTENAQTQETDSVIATDQTEGEMESPITEEQALEAIRQYCFADNSELEKMAASDDYNIYWDVTTNEKGEIVVLFHSYTGSQNRYYINPETGETYGTELVPGIIDEEQRTEESFNVRDYMKEGESAAAGSDTGIFVCDGN
ncbi:MAG: hypothetical protein K6E18_05675 [Lachnospiraceae bacterium]|nr:hypothetical protein [Lachnospiraceae bacterium]